MPRDFPERVKIVEVGPRDGLQNEPAIVSTADKLAFIEKLALAGHSDIEVTSFVSPRAIPQMSDALEVAAALTPLPGVRFHALVPNYRGLERAVEAGIRRIVVFTAASDAFAQKNINMTIARSLEVFAPVVKDALNAGISVRAYISTCFVCPYTGDVPKERVREVTQALLELGADEVSISDTIGAAAPRDVYETVGYVLERVPVERIALHYHDTYGTALANVLAGLELGVTTFDASAGGIGGCPFAPGATGNLATEDLVYMLDRMGIDTGVDLNKLADASRSIARVLGRGLPSRNLQRLNAAHARR
jgi:isopropylmalate/homocitrate/citramalate synthase